MQPWQGVRHAWQPVGEQVKIGKTGVIHSHGRLTDNYSSRVKADITGEIRMQIKIWGAAAAMALVILAISIAATLVILRALRVPKGATI